VSARRDASQIGIGHYTLKPLLHLGGRKGETECAVRCSRGFHRLSANGTCWVAEYAVAAVRCQPGQGTHLQAQPRLVTCARRASTASSNQHRATRYCTPSSLACVQRSPIRDQRSEICTAVALLSRSPAPGLQLQKWHDKMVAALLHRELRVPPWARQRGLWARVCVPLQSAKKVVGCPVPSGVEQGREDLVLKIVVDQTR
jgi:hypothetical protein